MTTATIVKKAAKIEDKLFLDRFKVATESHLRIIDSEKCVKECKEQACLYLCPARVYRLEEDHIAVGYEGCLECGSCRIACPHLNIEWRFPKGGYGISHKFG
ncbi:MAG: 4Fe-4S dicluster domain-containing protein [Chloroflexi bacterium]|nr:4Fe-4S dicluster domain-containing protein [Chloroflexota bacterium]